MAAGGMRLKTGTPPSQPFLILTAPSPADRAHLCLPRFRASLPPRLEAAATVLTSAASRM
eukprot:130326-Chlamydomonas_euryale.AAC.5